PAVMGVGLQQQGVSAGVADRVANTPPVGSLFAAFLGYNPIAELLAPSGALQQPGVDADVLTGTTFFPQLISGPFHAGLTVVFIAAAVMMMLGALTSLVSPGRYATEVRAGD
ncbi:MAG TPA: MFS transporter, partial [Mycobacterium sp.]|nr:MFS transporter [Mycobacterium sp.]